MFLRKEKRKGRLYLSIVQSYWDAKTKISKTKTIQSLGYLDVLEKDYADPIAHFTQVAKEMTEEYNEQTKAITLSINPKETLAIGTNLVKNFGYAALSQIYHELGIERFFNGRQRGLNIDYNLNSVVKLLVFGRAIFPDSKKSTFEQKNQLFDKTDFLLPDVYRTMLF